MCLLWKKIDFFMVCRIPKYPWIFTYPRIFQGMCYNCVTLVNCYWDNIAIICPWELYITKKTVAKLKYHAIIMRDLMTFSFSDSSTDTCQTFASCNTEMSIPYKLSIGKKSVLVNLSILIDSLVLLSSFFPQSIFHQTEEISADWSQ